ncbi:hypothetical protein Droror1_Dr00005422 [Drosera rotundifolia]
MPVKDLQAKPLAPAVDFRSSSSDEEEVVTKWRYRKHSSRRRDWVIAFIPIVILILLVVGFTAFHVRGPKITINNISVKMSDVIARVMLSHNANVSLVTEVSITNPNFASFSFNGSTTTLWYDGIVIGGMRGPSGKARAWRTLTMNLTVEVVAERFLSAPNFLKDVASNSIKVSGSTTIVGKLKIFNMFDKHLEVGLNCTMRVNITSSEIKKERCKRHISI